MSKEEEEASYSMNDENNYICSDDHNNENNTNLKHAWGTWEELLLACAVKRHGFCDWDSVATEVRSRTSVSSVFISADNCRHKYRDLQRRFHESADVDNNEVAAEGGYNIPWLEELRSLRVAELRREVQRYDVSILSLQMKVKKLEEERDGGEKLDLEEERKVERSENEKAVTTAEESDRENRSMNESNSTGPGDKAVGEDERVGGNEPSQARGGNADPDPVNTAGEGSEASGSGELGESGTSRRKWRSKRLKHIDGEIRSAASQSQPLIRLLDLIRSHPRGSLFERRVRSQETKVYKSLVKQHLDVETIERKLKQGSYDSSRLTLYRDLQLLFANAVTFFPSSSSESMAAHELRAIVSEEMRKETGKPSPRLIKQEASGAMTSMKPHAAETSEQKSSAPLVVCKRRRFVSAKAASPSSSSFSQKEETKEERLSGDEEDLPTGGRSSKRAANNTKTGKGKNKQKQAEAKTEKKVVSSDKKKSVADFLNRIKKSSPQKEEKDQSKSGGNGKKESKPKPRELRSNNIGKKKKAEVENSTPAKRAPGRPPQKKTVETATASGKRGRESGSTGKDNKQPKKRSRR